jgi:hypothetical protein
MTTNNATISPSILYMRFSQCVTLVNNPVVSSISIPQKRRATCANTPLQLNRSELLAKAHPTRTGVETLAQAPASNKGANSCRNGLTAH